MRAGKLLVGMVVGTLLTLGISGRAMADDYRQAVPGSKPPDAICLPASFGDGCFEKHGDRWWIRDLSSDPMDRAAIHWQNELWDGLSWGPFPYREGDCTSTNLRKGQWGFCNQDYYEDSSDNAWGGQGSRLRWQVCVESNCSAWTTWYRNDA